MKLELKQDNGNVYFTVLKSDVDYKIVVSYKLFYLDEKNITNFKNMINNSLTKINIEDFSSADRTSFDVVAPTMEEAMIKAVSKLQMEFANIVEEQKNRVKLNSNTVSNTKKKKIFGIF